MQASVPTTSTIIFPDEIIFHILHFLDPCELIRLRQVSRQFNAVTRDTRLWRALYTNSRLPRPSGPFLWQSAQFLEYALIHSAHVSQTWTSQPIRAACRIEGPQISVNPSPVSTSFDFLFGRLAIWCEGEQLFAQDVETGIGRLLWQSSEPISSINACSLTLLDAERVFVALRYVDQAVSQRTPIKLLELPIQDDTRITLGPVTFEMDLPEYADLPLRSSPPFLCFDGGFERLFGYPCRPMVMDARTRVTYTFPMFSTSLDAANRMEFLPWRPEFTLPSRKHILVFHSFDEPNRPMTLIQAFVTPDSSTHLPDADNGQLRLSHEALAELCYAPSRELRDPVLDPVTGETIIRLLSTDTRHGETHFRCIDITIPPESTEVLPMFITTQELFVCIGHRQNVFFGVSNDGHGRGIFTSSCAASPVYDDPPVLLYKFSIDASGERCTGVVSERRILSPQDIPRYGNRSKFDGVTGRICYHSKVQKKWLELVVVGLR